MVISNSIVKKIKQKLSSSIGRVSSSNKRYIFFPNFLKIIFRFLSQSNYVNNYSRLQSYISTETERIRKIQTIKNLSPNGGFVTPPEWELLNNTNYSSHKHKQNENETTLNELLVEFKERFHENNEFNEDSRRFHR